MRSTFAVHLLKNAQSIVCIYMTQKDLNLYTWSKECKVEHESQQNEPGVGRWAVVVGPEWATHSFSLVVTPGQKKPNDNQQVFANLSY